MFLICSCSLQPGGSPELKSELRLNGATHDLVGPGDLGDPFIFRLPPAMPQDPLPGLPAEPTGHLNHEGGETSSWVPLVFLPLPPAGCHSGLLGSNVHSIAGSGMSDRHVHPVSTILVGVLHVKDGTFEEVAISWIVRPTGPLPVPGRDALLEKRALLGPPFHEPADGKF